MHLEIEVQFESVLFLLPSSIAVAFDKTQSHLLNFYEKAPLQRLQAGLLWVAAN